MDKRLRLIQFIAISFLLFTAGCSRADSEKFAKCLTEKGVKMYGAFWCPHCAIQKDLFGSGFQYADYVECSLPDKSGQTQVCRDANIQSYPTWEFKDKSRFNGVQTLETLAQKSGCELGK